MNNQLFEYFANPLHPFHTIWKRWYRKDQHFTSEKLELYPPPSCDSHEKIPPAGRNDSRGIDSPSLRSASVSKETYPGLSALSATTILSAPFSNLSLSPGKDQCVKQDDQSDSKVQRKK